MIVVINGGGGNDNDPGAPTAPPPAAESGSPLNEFIIGLDEALRTFRDEVRQQRGVRGADGPEKPDPDPVPPGGDGDQSSHVPRGAGQWGRGDAPVFSAEESGSPSFPDAPNVEAAAIAEATASPTAPAERVSDVVFATGAPAEDWGRVLLLTLTVVGSVAAPMFDFGVPPSPRRRRWMLGTVSTSIW
jgi:hypothetical protein